MLRDGMDFYTLEGMSVAFTDLSLYDLNIYLYTDEETELLRRSIRDNSIRIIYASFTQ
ncbi:hypothetical protein K492DRAFT_201513 [Lichtheimia hyalospora FSU 10163]|nr:hypothetical protein K492DRAFT_201513 [Lichtheimia hyalospora FSU 10163]